MISTLCTRVASKIPTWANEAILFGSIYFILALINLRLKLLVTPAWIDGGLRTLHRALLAFEATNNEQSRLLQFYIPELIRRALHLAPIHSYMIQRWLFVFLALLCFHFYLRKWFDARLAFAGVVTLAAIMPLTYVNDLQESSPLLLLTFLLGLWMIRDHHTFWFALVLLIGALNNETILLLALVYFLYNFSDWNVRVLARLGALILLTALPAYLVTALIRYSTRTSPHLGEVWQLPNNVQGFIKAFGASPLDWWHENYLSVFFLYGALWVFAFLGYKSKPLFLQRAALMIPFFLAAHFIAGIISETRLLLPLSFILIPMAFYYLFRRENAMGVE